ncbi:uncharacterized protein SAPINGB_P002955 [Magnusiomyces paraingens]|uniref:Pre-mRNA-splicing factor ISY1 n=1 Tax=Magnusiomyces paraingens TaxID=2606893 RepID=A0A5E8BQL2_9ASCO|nr:uncharacterized protein SAPINGB_P002955 [Saprochaete ingens]VVT51013.1 unnamed protein product [Saprochaete ingens]
MSRNSEKSQSMLFRFREQQAAEMGVINTGRMRRPRSVQTVQDVHICEKWRGQINKEIGQKIVKIQDPALSEFQIRDINDEINKLMREKTAWEIQIKSLGGPNYLRFGSKIFDEHGNEIPQIITGGGAKSGYKYFGRARDLPDVKEMIEQEIKQQKLKREQTAQDKLDQAKFRDLPAEYFGFTNEKDKELYQNMLINEKEYSAHRFTQILNSKTKEQIVAEEKFVPLDNDITENVPTQEQVEKYLMERLRKKIEDRYDI